MHIGTLASGAVGHSSEHNKAVCAPGEGKVAGPCLSTSPSTQEGAGRKERNPGGSRRLSSDERTAEPKKGQTLGFLFLGRKCGVFFFSFQESRIFLRVSGNLNSDSTWKHSS